MESGLLRLHHLAVLLAVAWTFRGVLLGVNFDAGTGGRAELILPPGYRATVFAEGLDVGGRRDGTGLGDEHGP